MILALFSLIYANDAITRIKQIQDQLGLSPRSASQVYLRESEIASQSRTICETTLVQRKVEVELRQEYRTPSGQQSKAAQSAHLIDRPASSDVVVPEVARGYEEIYRCFYNGKLIFNNGEGEVVLPISDLSNPLNGRFDLSRCGDAGRYLSIYTGYRKSRNPANDNKIEIWFAPRFLIERELDTTARHFASIIGDWNPANSIGIFWTAGIWDRLDFYDYVTNQKIEELGNNNLFMQARNADTTRTLDKKYDGIGNRKMWLVVTTGADFWRSAGSFQISFPAITATVSRSLVSQIVIPDIARGYEDIYRRFYHGRLIYKRGQDTIVLPIANLSNPLGGVFDLSGCDDAGHYMQIATGYRTNKNPNNDHKYEIWIVPYFLLMKELETTAGHFRSIMDNWDGTNAPVGLFLAFGRHNLDCYYYLTNKNMEELGNISLYNKWSETSRAGSTGYPLLRASRGTFHVLFL